MAEQKLQLELERLLGRFGEGWSDAVITADIADIRQTFKEAGYLSHEEVQGLVEVAIMRARLGYVKLASPQPENVCIRFTVPAKNADCKDEFVLVPAKQTDWRRVILEEKDGQD